MKAKMTEYKGIYFRSRLEARWCEFFEYLGVRFEYEPETHATSIGGYIPDFYFKSLKTWVEIKGKPPTKDEITKLEDVCIKTNRFGLIISGYPEVFPFGVEPHTANCACRFISNKGNVIFLSLDDIYQISKNEIALHMLEKCKPDALISLNFLELFRCKGLMPANAKFKPNKYNLINTTKLTSRTLATLAKKLDSY